MSNKAQDGREPKIDDCAEKQGSDGLQTNEALSEDQLAFAEVLGWQLAAKWSSSEADDASSR